MNSLIQNTVSFFEKRIAARQRFATSSRGDAIVSGYSFLSNVNRHDPLPGDCDRRQAGIFYADIANYLRPTEQDEEGTHHRLVESMKILKAYIIASNGRVVHTAGDAILAEFKDVCGALHCAVNVQLAARELNARLHINQRVLFRIGVNFGDVIADNGEIYGNAVNLAARLEKLAHSGGICVSKSARSELEDNSAYNFVALGKQYVKNISEPVQAFWIELDAQQVVDAEFTGSVKVSAMAS
jgi:adenylate cyclase